MSAWVVSKRHIDAMVQAGLETARRDGGEFTYYHGTRRCELDGDSADRVGAMLWEENKRSVDYRYSETNEREPYTFQRRPSLAPVVILKALDCYEYQSCEHDAWNTSEARAYCEALRKALISELPGYNAAPWGLDEAEREVAS